MEKFYLLLGTVIFFVTLYYFFNQKVKIFLENEKERKEEQKMWLNTMNEIRREIFETSLKNRVEIQGRMDRLSENLNNGLRHSSEAMLKTVNSQFNESRTLIRDTSEKITRFEETNKKIASFAGQLQSLENILKNPKQRGILGEYYLEALLKNVFEPHQYELQYHFNNGEIVDAVIFYDKKILSIDSKFSLENYNRFLEERTKEGKDKFSKELVCDLKKRIQEAVKYIRPEENTFDFVIMFIPSEGLYYDLLSAKIGLIKESAYDLIEFAHRKKVILVSPSSFYAYLQTILHGLKLVQMKDSLEVFKKNVEKLDKHLKTYESYFNKVGNHLSMSVNSYNRSCDELLKVDKDIYKISQNKQRDALKTQKVSEAVK